MARYHIIPMLLIIQLNISLATMILMLKTKKRYDIPTNQAPKLLLKGSGDLKGSSIGSKNIEFTFVEKKEKIFILLMMLNLPRVRISND